KLINKLIENGIEPMVTMQHFDLPQKLQQLGGFTNSIIVKYFEEYAQEYANLLYQRFGDRVKYWITINQPAEFCVQSYGSSNHAPGINAHGIDTNDMVTVDRALQFSLGWVAHPIFSSKGGYPSVMIYQIAKNSEKGGQLRSRLPEFSDDWIEKIRGSADFLGLIIFFEKYWESIYTEAVMNDFWGTSRTKIDIFVAKCM
ncbi:myrosinase 1-like, partial [Sitodiplosis mosellana]|uniref:myrosinase 1-like n=1 Tax=Sitodiplosis mosellana TaxID=263140 RepID=UPI002444630B